MSNDRLEEIRKNYRASFEAKADELMESWRSVESGYFNDAEVAELRSLTHKLAGSAGMYGYDGIASLSRALERRLVDGPEDSVAWRKSIKAELLGVVGALRESE